MAVDELLVGGLRPGICIARFFNWAGAPGATFGYAQFESSARQQISAAGIQNYTRRPTGGGVVLHKDDLTFSLCFAQEGVFKPAAIYAALHRVIKEEFNKALVTLTAYDKAGDYRPAPGGVSSNCFTNPVSDDLLGPGGEKALGGAIRRYGNAVLYQGSLQLKGARANAAYRAALKNGILKYFNAEGGAQNIGNALLNEAYALAQSRYKTKEWIQKF